MLVFDCFSAQEVSQRVETVRNQFYASNYVGCNSIRGLLATVGAPLLQDRPIMVLLKVLPQEPPIMEGAPLTVRPQGLPIMVPLKLREFLA